MNADDLATALTTGASGWLVLSVAAVLPILWAFTLSLHFARPYVLRFLQDADPPLRRRRVVAVLRPDPGRAAGHHAGPEHDLLHAQPVPEHAACRSRRRSPRCSCCWATVVKLIRDVDDDPAAFRLFSVLLVDRVRPVHRPPGLRHGGRRPGATSATCRTPLISTGEPRPRPADPVGQPRPLRSSRAAPCSPGS